MILPKTSCCKPVAEVEKRSVEEYLAGFGSSKDTILVHWRSVAHFNRYLLVKRSLERTERKNAT